MKNVKFLAIATAMIVISTVLTACGENRSEVTTKEDPVIQEDTAKPVVKEKQEDKFFEFWAKEIQVSPLSIDLNGTYGEGEVPAKTLKYEFFFIDSFGNEKKFTGWAYLPKEKPSSPEDQEWYKNQQKDFDHLKTLYDEVVNAPVGRIFVNGHGGEVITIKKGVDLKTKKVGNAIIRESSTIELH